MLKKFIVVYIAVVMLFTGVYAGADAPAGISVDTGGAAAAILTDADTGRTLQAVNADKPLPAAGLSRLPALLMICDAFDAGLLTDETVVSVSEEASHIRGTTAFLAAGEQMKAYDMMMAAVMINAGDAVHALACAAAGTVQGAAERINGRLKALGVSAVYADICGEGAALSCADLAKIGGALLKSGTYNRFGTKFYETITHNTGAGPTELANPNKLIKQYSGCLGIATGSSNAAGYCGVFAAKRGNTSYISVVLGAGDSKTRFRIGSELLNGGFAAFRSVMLAGAGDIVGKIKVKGSLAAEIGMAVEKDVYALIELTNTQYRTVEELPEYIEAPIEKGDIIGKIRYVDLSGEPLGEVNIIASDTAERSGFLDYIKLIIGFWIRFL